MSVNSDEARRAARQRRILQNAEIVRNERMNIILGTDTASVVPIHPTYQEMVKVAVSTLKEPRGSSKSTILKYILAHYEVGDKINKINAYLRSALKRGVTNGYLKQVKGDGSSVTFRLVSDSKTKTAIANKPKKTTSKKKTTARIRKPKEEMTSDIVPPIFWLPDELLTKICSYITNIPNKMALEQISKRFRFISSQSISWDGVKKLEMDLHTNCCHLNKCAIPFTRWPAAIQLLVDRTQIQQLIICDGGVKGTRRNNTAILTKMIKILKEKVQIQYLECKYYSCGSDGTLIIRDLFDNVVESFFFKLLQMSVPHLQEFVFNVSCRLPQTSMEPIWNLIKECNHLNSICLGSAYYPIRVDFSALIGKPLNKVWLIDVRHTGSSIVSAIVDVVNGTTGNDIQELTLAKCQRGLRYFPPDDDEDIDFKGFSDRLNEKARKSLKLMRIKGMFQDVMKYCHLIPSMFPSMTRLESSAVSSEEDYDINQLFTNMVTFLTVSEGQSIPREIVIYKLECPNIHTFKSGLTTACEMADINVEFGDLDDNEYDYLSQSVFLSKGNSSIRIHSVESYVDLESDDEDGGDSESGDDNA